MTVSTESLTTIKRTTTKVVELSAAAEARVRELVTLYPNKRSAVMPALYIAQDELGHVTNEAIAWVAARIGMPAIQVREVATFYTMFYQTPVGKYHIQVCRTLPCALRGAKVISEFLHKRLKLTPGEISADGMWSWQEVECLGSCGSAPMCEINDCYFENLDEQLMEQVLQWIEQSKPQLRFSTVKEQLGENLNSELPPGCPCAVKRGG